MRWSTTLFIFKKLLIFFLFSLLNRGVVGDVTTEAEQATGTVSMENADVTVTTVDAMEEQISHSVHADVSKSEIMTALPEIIPTISNTENDTAKSTPDSLDLPSNNSNSSGSNNRSKQWSCKPMIFNNTDANKTVVLIEGANLTAILNSLNESNGCALVFFYLRWCRFSSLMASKINLIGLYYPEELPVIAIDVHKSPGLAAKYGIVGVPTTLLFYGKKPVAKFNGSSTIDDLHLFIKETTGFVSKVNVTEALINSTTGPLPITPDKKRDVYLFFSILFLVFLSLSKIINTESLVALRGRCYRTVMGLLWPPEHPKED